MSEICCYFKYALSISERNPVAFTHSTDVTLIECVTASCMVVSGDNAIYKLSGLANCVNIMFYLRQNAIASAAIKQFLKII